jgi:hypothetical protein
LGESLSVNPKRAGIVDGMFLTAQGFFSKIYCHDVLAWHKRRQLLIRTYNEPPSAVAADFGQHCSLNRWIQTALSNSRNAVSFPSACTMNRRPSSRCASTIQIVRPLESIAETQPTDAVVTPEVVAKTPPYVRQISAGIERRKDLRHKMGIG